MTTTRRLQFDPQAIKEKLEKNKEKAAAKGKTKKTITIHENPIIKVDKAGKYLFRATYYPHSPDPVAEPFPIRHYHFEIPGTGIVYCPQLNLGETCPLCDFLWDEMKSNKGNTDKVKFYARKLPKARVWIPGKLRGREDEGVKFFSMGTALDKMSDNHTTIMEWFNKKGTAKWLDPIDGFDMVLEYEEYDPARSKQMNGAKFGLKKIDLERDEQAEFGDDFDQFMDSIPDVDNSDNDVLKSYRRRTTEEVSEALERWDKQLQKDVKKSDRVVSQKEATKSDVDTKDEESSSEEQTYEVTDDDAPVSKGKSSVAEKLKKFGINV